MRECGILIPTFDFYLQDRCDQGCLNKDAHFDEHINVLLTDKEIILWEFEFCPGCETCDPAESQCFVHESITVEKALEILNKNYRGNIPEEVLEILEKIKI